MPGTTRIILAILLGVLLGAGCGGDSDDKCKGGCPDGQYCEEEGCAPCAVDAHCGINCLDCSAQATNQACVNGKCGCATDADCADDQTCIDDLCKR
jgi:hypothetical protein